MSLRATLQAVVPMPPVARIITGVIACAGLLGVTFMLTRSSRSPATFTPLPDAPAPARELPEGSASGLVGVVVASESVDVAARTSGLVTDVRVRLGDRVTRGDIIATIDTSALEDELAMARAQLSAAESAKEKVAIELEEARERLQRWTALDATGGAVVSKEEVANVRYKEKYARQELKAASATVAEHWAAIKKLQRQIAEAEVRAPFDGLVASRHVSAGATVAPGEPIVRLLLADELWVRFAVAEEQGSRVRKGQAVDVRVEEHGPTLSAAIEKIAPEIDVAARMLIVEARLEAPTHLHALRGRTARVFLRPQDEGANTAP